MEASHHPASDATATSQRLMTGAILAGLIAAGLALWLLVWLGHEVLTDTPAPVLDDRFRTAIHSLSSPGLTQVMIAASRYGGPGWLAPLGVIIARCLSDPGWRRGPFSWSSLWREPGSWILCSRSPLPGFRPTAFFDYPLAALAQLSQRPRLLRRQLLRRPGDPGCRQGFVVRSCVRWSGCAAFGLIVLIGFSRVYLGVHYPSDVLAGYAAATIWVAGVAFGDRVVRHRRRAGVA